MRIKAPGFRIGSSHEVAFSPDGQYLAAIRRDDLALWGVSSRQRLRATRALQWMSEIAFAPDGTRFTLKNTIGQIAVLDTVSLAPIAAFAPKDRDEGSNLAYLGESDVVDGSWDGEIRVRNAVDLRPRIVWREDHTMVTGVLAGRPSDLWAFVVKAKHIHPKHADGADRVLLSRDPRTGVFTALPLRWRGLNNGALALRGDRIALRTGGTQQELLVVDVASGAVIATATASQGGTGCAIAWSPDGRHLVLVERGGFSIRDVRDLREVGWLASPFPAAMAFSPAGDLIALGDWQAGFVARWPEVLGTVEPRRPS